LPYIGIEQFSQLYHLFTKHKACSKDSLQIQLHQHVAVLLYEISLSENWGALVNWDC